MRWKEGANQWNAYSLKDDKGVAFANPKIKSVAVADEALYVIDENGQAWRYNRVGKKPTPAPLKGQKVRKLSKKKKKKKGKKQPKKQAGKKQTKKKREAKKVVKQREGVSTERVN